MNILNLQNITAHQIVRNFVNGILDSLLIELKREGAIKKIGRLN